MANLMRYDPFNEIARLDPFRDIEDLMRDFGRMPAWRGAEAVPPVRIDVAETDQAYVLKAEIPGVKKEDIKVAIDGNRVTLTAEIKRESETTQQNMLRSERFYGQQSRSFTLPQEVDDAQAVAKYNDGILELTLPKKPGSAPKQLQIQ